MNISIPSRYDGEICDIAEDFVAYAGMEDPSGRSLVYEWVPAETPGSFVAQA